ncbi:MAG: zinc ribbon domain-containing protein [Pirellulaceae bacterium]
MEEGPSKIMAFARLMGTRWCGEVDRVPGVLYVATIFFHVLGVPLFPLQSWIILLDLRGSKTAASVAIGWDAKSILIAIVRAVLVVATVSLGVIGAGGMVGFAMGVNGWLLPTILCGFFAPFLATLLFTYRLGEATIPRAEELAIRAGFSEMEAHAIADDVRQGALDEHGRGALDASFQEVLCPKCGRIVAKTTRVCPRCERRLDGPDSFVGN